METFLHVFVIYVFLLVILRFSGKRTLSEMSTFDFVLLLIISEATQNALVGEDYSLTKGVVVILVLVALDRLVGFWKSRSETADKIIEGTPLVLVDHGRVLHDCIRRAHVSESDILQAARQSQGIGTLQEIKYAVLETSGGISIIPADDTERLERCVEAAVARALARGARTS